MPQNRKISIATATTSTRLPRQYEGALPSSHESIVPISGNGFNTISRDFLLCVDRHNLVVAMGKCVVLHHLQTQELTFLPLLPARSGDYKTVVGEITAMAICGKRHILAICRAATNDGDGATISFYSLLPSTSTTNGINGAKSISKPTIRYQHHKTLHFATERFSGVALSHDGSLACCLAANVTWSLIVWDWRRGRQIAQTDVHCRVTCVRFNAVDMAQLSTSGGTLLRIWTLSQYSLRVLANFKSGDETKTKHAVPYVDHAWLPEDALVALLANGDVQFIVNAELVQTVRTIHDHWNLTCLTALNTNDSIIVGGEGGWISVFRVDRKVLKTKEKELHLQRRLRVQSADSIRSLTTDPTGVTLFCWTESFCGTYDLSNLCLLSKDDETVALTSVASTPTFATHMMRLSAASCRPYVAALCTLPSTSTTTSSHALRVWNQFDCHDCTMSHTFESATAPLAMDLHPSGAEVVISFPAKLQIWLVVQDAPLRLAFELPGAKQLGFVEYSSTGSSFAGVQLQQRAVFLFRTFTRERREPQLLRIYREFGNEAITLFRWCMASDDRQFLVADAGGVIRQCRLFPDEETQIVNDDEAEEEQSTIAVRCLSRTCVLSEGNSITAVASCALENESQTFVVFLVENAPVTPFFSSTSLPPSATSRTHLRAFVNGKLDYDALLSAREFVDTTVTALAASSSPSGHMLFVGTSTGAVLAIDWRFCSSHSSRQTIELLSPLRHVELHTSSVVGLAYSHCARLLFTNSSDGIILACSVPDTSSDATRSRHIVDEMGSHITTTGTDPVTGNSLTTVVSVCQPEEVSLYDRNAIELRKLRLMDLETEFQQLKLENDLLLRQQGDQQRHFDDALQRQLLSASENAALNRLQLQSEMHTQQQLALNERDKQIQSVISDARSAQDHYTLRMETLQQQNETLQKQLHALQTVIEDERFAAQEREAAATSASQAQIAKLIQQAQARETELTQEVERVTLCWQETLRQQTQDQDTQLAMLSTSLQEEKARNAAQMTSNNGQVAAMRQEIKLLLHALDEKVATLMSAQQQHQRLQQETLGLKERLQEQQTAIEVLVKEKADDQHRWTKQQNMMENLQRLNTVHRSQIDLLQKHLVPKDQQLTQMQQYLTQLHDANQEIILQANMSDRLRAETAQHSKKHEQQVATLQRRAEKLLRAIMVLQEELSELVKRSAAQDKSAVVGELLRMHKRLGRQLDDLQATGNNYASAEDVSAELHRQNFFLVKDKEHVRKQMEQARQEKHKLVAALSFQNATLVAELNVLKKQNKELERTIQRQKEKQPQQRDKEGNIAPKGTTTMSRSWTMEDDLLDARSVLHPKERPGQTAAAVPAKTVRPKSAGALSSRRNQRPASAASTTTKAFPTSRVDPGNERG